MLYCRPRAFSARAEHDNLEKPRADDGRERGKREGRKRRSEGRPLTTQPRQINKQNETTGRRPGRLHAAHVGVHAGQAGDGGRDAGPPLAGWLRQWRGCVGCGHRLWWHGCARATQRAPVGVAVPARGRGPGRRRCCEWRWRPWRECLEEKGEGERAQARAAHRSIHPSNTH